MTIRRVRRFFLVPAVMAALLLAACGTDDGGADGAVDDTPTDGAVDAGADDGTSDGAGGDADGAAGGGTSISPVGSWLLQSVSLAGADVPVPAEGAPDLQLAAGEVTGNGGCNSFGGTLELDLEGAFAATDLFITEMACEPFALNEFEGTYLEALAAADTWEVTPDGLVLRGPGAELTFTPLG